MSPHAYPEQTRHVARACADLGLTFSDLDAGGGYLWAVGDGTHELVGGAGAICAYPLNTAAAVQIARDKAHANTAMTRAGLAVIPSRLLFITPDRIALRGPGREIADALAYLAATPGPVFCKPNSGSGGDFAEIVEGEAAFLD
jgi:biotin carboxylase